MPSAKYYRSILPLDILQIVGNFAGDHNYKLVFTFSPKRRFISKILIGWRHIEFFLFEYRYFTTILKDYSWKPVRLGCIAEVLMLLGEKCNLPEHIMVPSMKRITDILLEVHDYTLRR